MTAVIATALGLQRFQLENGNIETNIVSVDFTANTLIVSASDVFNQQRYNRTYTNMQIIFSCNYK